MTQVHMEFPETMVRGSYITPLFPLIKLSYLTGLLLGEFFLGKYRCDQMWRLAYNTVKTFKGMCLYLGFVSITHAYNITQRFLSYLLKAPLMAIAQWGERHFFPPSEQSFILIDL